MHSLDGTSVRKDHTGATISEGTFEGPVRESRLSDGAGGMKPFENLFGPLVGM